MVNILLIQFFAKQLHRFAKALEVYDLALTEELDHIIYIRVIAEPEDVVIGDPCLLLWRVKLFTTKIIPNFGNE